MQAPTGNKTLTGGLNLRLDKLGIVLPAPPTPLGSYVETSDAGNLLFLSGMLPVVNRRLTISGRLGENLSVKEGQEAARTASLNALAAAKHHLGDLDRLTKLVKLTVLMATTERGGWCVKSICSNLWSGGRPRSIGLWGAKSAHWRPCDS